MDRAQFGEPRGLHWKPVLGIRMTITCLCVCQGGSRALNVENLRALGGRMDYVPDKIEPLGEVNKMVGQSCQ